MSWKFLTTEEAFDYSMSSADDSDDSDSEMIILPPDPDIVTDDEEIDDACTSIEHGHVIFDEKLQEETTGSIEILKKKVMLNLFQHLNGLIVHLNFHQLLNNSTLYIRLSRHGRGRIGKI
ncbi:hypothetical protein AVEN_49890-1 [Araneus ventricosus]|uniref:PiggyBac transposable element-derived protein domain-containing protein n=1 Tax=Araneus ventricosus TaxID=182803 RepID=A0A4Y2SU44_ARAVE|nr:hypothetical protein AVEN_49890-1 [Araneus ventricosus]